MAQDGLLRLFVAVELGEDIARSLAGLQAELRRQGLQELRWVRPEQVHLTLKFLGETPADRVPAIRAALSQAVQGVAPHRLRLDGLQTFGDRRGPQVLWLDLQGDVAELARLQRRLDDALAPAGFAREKRQFVAHLTLARVRPQSARAMERALAAALAAVEPAQGALEVREIALIRSVLTPAGPIYHRLATFPLAGALE